MASVKLDQQYTIPTYPKLGKFELSEKSIHVGSLSAATVISLGYEDPYLCCGSQLWRAMFELENVMREESPFEVAMAAMSIAYWSIKGMEYNYGGVNVGKLQKQVADYAWMCKGYTTADMFKKVDEARVVLENFGDGNLQTIAKMLDSSRANQLGELYSKLMLLVYDYVLGGVIYDIDGFKGEIDRGYSANTVTYGTGDLAWSKTTLDHDVSYYDHREAKPYPLIELMRPELIRGYKKGREAVMNEVLRYDPSFPQENTWLYYGIDVGELNRWIMPIYGDTVSSCRCENKRKNVKAAASGFSNNMRELKDWYFGIIKLNLYIWPVLFIIGIAAALVEVSVILGLIFGVAAGYALFRFYKKLPGRRKAEKVLRSENPNYPYTFGKLTNEEKPLRRTITLIH